MIVKDHTSAICICEFIYGCAHNGIEIGEISTVICNENEYIHWLNSKKGTKVATFNLNNYLVKTENNEIEIHNKESFVKNFTTPWEYE